MRWSTVVLLFFDLLTMHTRISLPLLATLLAALFVWAGCDTTLELDESGELIKEDIKVGTGEEALSGTRIQIHMEGSLENGNVFADTYQNNRPLVFTLGQEQVIEGWEQGIPGMREGGIRRLTIPPRLAFGTSNINGVPPNSTVIFDVELLRVDHPDSLAIEDLQQGQGPLVEMGDTLTVNYIGYLGSGQVFDASSYHGGPYTFIMGAGGVIEGWEQGLLNMREGGIRRLTIPPRLGYGDEPFGGIPANSTLIFEVQLIQLGS